MKISIDVVIYLSNRIEYERGVRTTSKLQNMLKGKVSRTQTWTVLVARVASARSNVSRSARHSPRRAPTVQGPFRSAQVRACDDRAVLKRSNSLHIETYALSSYALTDIALSLGFLIRHAFSDLKCEQPGDNWVALLV